jgi:hypothetical protein
MTSLQKETFPLPADKDNTPKTISRPTSSPRPLQRTPNHIHFHPHRPSPHPQSRAPPGVFHPRAVSPSNSTTSHISRQHRQRAMSPCYRSSNSARVHLVCAPFSHAQRPPVAGSHKPSSEQKLEVPSPKTGLEGSTGIDDPSRRFRRGYRLCRHHWGRRLWGPRQWAESRRVRPCVLFPRGQCDSI